VIEFLTAEGISPVEIHRRMQVVYGDDCVDVSTVHRWANTCKDGEPGISDLCDKQRIGRTVTETDEFHKEQVDKMIKENRRITQKDKLRWVRKHKSNILLQHDKARPHTLSATMETIGTLNLNILPHPPYCPDFVPRDFHLFPKAKQDLSGHQCASNEAVKRTVTTWLRKQSADFFSDGFITLVY
jgi:hypothetical protein